MPNMLSKITGIYYLNKLIRSNSTSNDYVPSSSNTDYSPPSPPHNTRSFSVTSQSSQEGKKQKQKKKSPRRINRSQVRSSIPSSRALQGRRSSTSQSIPTVQQQQQQIIKHQSRRRRQSTSSTSVESSSTNSSTNSRNNSLSGPNYKLSSPQAFEGSDNFLFHHDLTIDLKMVNSNNIRNNEDVWSYNPEEGHTITIEDPKKQVRFT
ncbi:uncharacterized protein J8A68_002380 [[Candida] subhashii]|uniref:Uncharacterized protein n=1 Tax=[Candida] subhashii TaxID=561895 RepID=A0A8J5UPA8_9ASCO|nr:uncharacterized protein J8A68_002380 [[Candida] subhashii]KAG7664126.1 hypothetical protein J8A68_002380 [[Candida] subhashii]